MKGIELSEKNVRLHVRARDWEEAVRIGGRILVETGTAKESYVEGIVNSIKKYGPYVVISKGFAIPHTRAAVSYTHLVADASDTSAYDLSQNKEQLILFTCYPLDGVGEKEDRLFVYADKVSGPRVVGDTK